jgi:Actin-rearrangement-inducing factor (Arif-1)
MARSLSCIVLAVITGAVGSVFVALGAIGIAQPNAALLIDYENGTPTYNCSGFVSAYGLVMIIIGIGVFMQTQNHYALTILAAAAMTMVATFLCALNWVVRFGHLPLLDVYARTYDTDAACWGGITLQDYNTIVTAPPGPNCFVEQALTFCVACRAEYYRDEPTFIKSHRFLFVFALFALLTHNIYSMWYLYKQSTAAALLSSASPTNCHTATSDCSININAYCDYKQPDLYDNFEYMVPKNNRPISLLLPPPPISWSFA